MEKYFDYLDDLRESGITNMWNAPTYLKRDFNLDKKSSQLIFQEWMKIKRMNELIFKNKTAP